MAITVTQANFNGKAAGFYISAALKASNSLDYLTSIENIKSYMGNIIAEATENSIWSGTNVAGQFNGFLGLVTGLLLPGPDPTVVQDGAAAAPYTAGNIISNLQSAVAAIPTQTLGKEDLHIYMSQRSYQYYIGAVSTLGYVNAYNMNGDYVPMFEGYKLAVCNGMEENQMVVAQTSNLFFGTDLLSDSTRIDLLDMSFTGSDNLRLVCKYSAGVQTGTGADIVRQS
jgi:hypothetical protein